jgi:hypothetical protein
MKRLFIVGCPRSGSTWSTLLLAQHPEVAACQHVGIFHDALIGLEKWWGKQEKLPDHRFGKSVIVLPSDENKNEAAPQDFGADFVPILSEEEFYGICRTAATAVYDKVLRHKPQAQVVVDKTTESHHVAKFILSVFPEAYFLHIIRDPRSVVCSLRSGAETIDRYFPTVPLQGARRWCSEVERCREISQLTPKYREIRYEALLARGPAELDQLLSWLGLEADPSFCQKACEAAHIDNLRKITTAPRNFFRKGLADGWREELSPSDLRNVEYVARDLMDELGYESALKSSRRKPVRVSMHDARRWGFTRALSVAKRLRRSWQL